MHVASWPVAEDYRTGGDPAVLEATSAALIQLRRVKSEAKVSPRTPYLSVTLSGPNTQIGLLDSVQEDLKAATKSEGVFALAGAEDSTEFTVTDFKLGTPPQRNRG